MMPQQTQIACKPPMHSFVYFEYVIGFTTGSEVTERSNRVPDKMVLAFCVRQAYKHTRRTG